MTKKHTFQPGEETYIISRHCIEPIWRAECHVLLKVLREIYVWEYDLNEDDYHRVTCIDIWQWHYIMVIALLTLHNDC